MKEIFGNRFDVRIIIDGKEYYPKEVSLQSSEGTSFKWKERHWNTGTEGMAGAFDVVHRIPKGLNKPKVEKSTNCPHCGAPVSLRVQHYATAYVYGGGYCESWAAINKRWVLIGRTEW